MICSAGRCLSIAPGPEMQRIAAVSIARPLAAELAGRPFLGQVVGVFSRACYIGGRQGQVIALTLAEAGPGPFSVALQGRPGLFEGLSVGQPARGHDRSLHVDGWEITWDAAAVWDPRLVCPACSLELGPDTIRIISKYADWTLMPITTPRVNPVRDNPSSAADRLGRAVVLSLVQNRPNTLAKAVAGLAGLGRGLTPAGDDYLLGVLAALWLTGQAELLADISIAAAAKTTWLSGAYLRAAAIGEFAEPWHSLALALHAADTAGTAKAMGRIAGYGASSGRDALAGFASTILAFYRSEHVPSFGCIEIWGKT